MAELKSLTLNESKYDSFVDRTARSAIETLAENLPDSGFSAEEVRQILADYLEEHPIPSTGGLSSVAAALLIDILQSATYSTDVSQKIERLQAALVSDGSSTETPEVVTYTITTALTNVTTDSTASTVTAGAGYTAVLSPAEGYRLDSVTVTMGGVDITDTAYSDSVVSIGAVTGDVIITASAVENGQDPQLPTGLTRVAYLQTDGACYIDTGHLLKAKDGFTLQCNWGEIASWSAALGAYDTFTIVYIVALNGLMKLNLASSEGGVGYSIDSGSRPTLGTHENITITTRGGSDNNYLYYSVTSEDGTKIASGSHANTGAWFDLTQPLYLFAVNKNGTASNLIKSGFKIRGFSCTGSDGTLLKNFIPVIDGQGVACMYETVHGTYHYNLGTGTFVVGEVI